MAQTRRMGMPHGWAQPPKRRGFRPIIFGYRRRAVLCRGINGSNPAHEDAERASEPPRAPRFSPYLYGCCGRAGALAKWA